MPQFRVMIQGGNLLVNSGEAKRMGFYHNHFVTSPGPREAEAQTTEAVRENLRSRGTVLNPEDDPPTLRVMEVEEVQAIPSKQQGYVWYSERPN